MWWEIQYFAWSIWCWSAVALWSNEVEVDAWLQQTGNMLKSILANKITFVGLIRIAETVDLTLLAPRKKITILLIGNHSAGKSTFINWYGALLISFFVFGLLIYFRWLTQVFFFLFDITVWIGYILPEAYHKFCWANAQYQ